MPDQIAAPPNNAQTKIKLIDFIEDAPDLWFSMAEVLFSTAKVADEKQKFSYLLQSLNIHQIEKIQTIIQAHGTNEKPYTDAKAKLLEVYGITEEKNCVSCLIQMYQFLKKLNPPKY